MNTLERMLISGFYIILLGISTWLLSTVSVNSGRILVLEQRTNNHTREMADMKIEIKEHRVATEFLNGKR